jgi:hypothetical protein
LVRFVQVLGAGVRHSNVPPVEGVGQLTAAGCGNPAQGNFVAIWLRFTGTGQQSDLLGRLFDAQGQPRGPIFQVSLEGPDDRQFAAVAMNQHGHFVVIWESFSPSALSYLRAQIFGPGGVRLGSIWLAQRMSVSPGGEVEPRSGLLA